MTSETTSRGARRTPDGYLYRPITLSYSYTEKLDDKGRVINSRPPGFLCGDWFLSNAGQATHKDWYFELADQMKVESDSEYGPLYWLPVPDNYHLLLQLDCVSELEKNILRYHFNWYREVFQQVGINALIFKMSATSVDGSPYKRVGWASTTVVTDQLPLPPPERLMATLRGLPLYREEKRLVHEFQPVDDHVLQSYAPFRLFSQQINGALACLAARRFALFKDMRTGKTDTALTAGVHLLRTGQVARVYVVCPSTNMYDPWGPAATRYGVRVALLDGSDEEDAQALLDRENEVVIVNYERVGLRLLDLLSSVSEDEYAVICDETSKIKNPEAQRSRATHRLCWGAAYVWLLNGTPCEQGPQDIWSQIACLDPYGFLWGATYNQYIKTWLALNRAGQTVVQSGRRAEWETLLTMMSLRYIRSEADQFLGKDKTFRYIRIPPTAVQVKDTAHVLSGLARNIKTQELHEIPNMILAQLTHTTEICNGYNKYPVGVRAVMVDGELKEQLIYCRQPYEMDAKILWLRAFLEANPTQPCVIFCSYTQQEQLVKNMLREIEHSFASLRPDLEEQRTAAIAARLPEAVAKALAQEFFKQDYLPGVGYLLPGQDVQVPEWYRYDERFIEWMNQHSPAHVTYVVEVKDEGSYPSARRGAEIQAFQHGQVQHFICKTAQGYGITLNRVPAMREGISSPPCIIFMNPPWSLGQYQQAQDRCVGSDEHGHSYCNMVYTLVIQGSVEEQILKALRGKKEVQEILLKDVDREGFQSFADDIIEGMRKSMEDKSLFDTEEMLARIRLGISPLTKLTKSVIEKAAKRKYGTGELPESATEAVTYLLGII